MINIQFLKNIHIGKIIHNEVKQQKITDTTLADKLNGTKCAIRKLFKQKSIHINKLIEISYLLGVNLLYVYNHVLLLEEKPEFHEDEVTIKIVKEQISLIPAKKQRAFYFLQSIHIGELVKREAKQQNVTEVELANALFCSPSTISRIFYEPDIDTERLIRLSEKLKYDFIGNIYLPYMAINEPKTIANDFITNECIISVKPQQITVATEKQTIFYHPA